MLPAVATIQDERYIVKLQVQLMQLANLLQAVGVALFVGWHLKTEDNVRNI